MTRWVIFAVISMALVAISWKSLFHPRSHGFYRFFAWEAILALIVINASVWFRDPFSWHQIIAWLLLFVSFVPLVYGVHFLRTRGKPTPTREGDDTLLGFEKTTALVTTGIFHYIRHPLYSSLLLLDWGVFFKEPSWRGMILAGAATLFLIFTAKTDETECVRFFGVQYQQYMRQTKMFIPFLF